MAEIKLRRKIIYSGEVFASLMDRGWSMTEAGNFLRNIREADAVEVVHGRWHKPTPCSQEFCTNCGLTPKTNFGWLPPYCPNCGAKMDGGNEDV